MISFVKVVKEPHVKPVQLASDSEIDVEKYVGYLHSTFDQVLDALGLDFEEIIGLTKLERFM
jgi:DNA polymerase I